MSELLDILSRADRKKARKKSFPNRLAFMLATLTEDYFDHDDWIYERKLDGERALAYISPRGKVRLVSRNQKTLNNSYPEIEDALREHAPRGMVVDGEVVAFDKNNVSDFQRLQPRMHAKSRHESLRSTVTVYFYVFDCLYADGRDLTRCPLSARKRVLQRALTWEDPLRRVSHRKGEGLAYYKEACKKGWEGVIAKDAGGRYVHGRSKQWLKFKCVSRQEFVIGGYTDPQGDRAAFGALLIGYYADGDFVYAGRVGTGFDDATLQSLGKKLRSLKRKTSPYDRGNPQGKGVHFVSPKLVCEVGFTEWTQGGNLRHPRYKGLRRDKDPKRVHRETAGRRANL